MQKSSQGETENIQKKYQNGKYKSNHKNKHIKCE